MTQLCVIWLATAIISDIVGPVLTSTGFDLQLITYSNTSFVLYWMQPTVYEDVNFYQVEYNITSVYDTDKGERRFNDQSVILQKLAHIELPLYTKNSVYSVQVIAMTTNSERISTGIVTYNASDFNNAGLEDAVTYFQLRLILPQDCSAWISEVENLQSRILSIRLAMIIGIQDACWEETVLKNDNCNFPAINVVEETLKCQRQNKVVYLGRIIGTEKASPKIILGYINTWIWLYNQGNIPVPIKEGNDTYILSIDMTCPQYLASPTDPNCTPELSAINISEVISIVTIIAMIILMITLTVTHFTNTLKQNEIFSATQKCNQKLNKC